MIFNEVQKDLFTTEEKYALAHCISLDCAMGAGIATEFVRRYPKMKNYLKRCIKENHLNYPITIIYDEKEIDNRIIFNLITKKLCFLKPTYTTLQGTLEQMRDLCIKNNIKYLAMPLIGCGIDGLSWDKVREMVKEVFSDIDIEILVCRL